MIKKPISFVLIGVILLSSLACVLGTENVNIDTSGLQKTISQKNNTPSNNFPIVYVDGSGGSDANPGTSDKPKKSIKSGVEVLPDDGTLNIAPGQYSGNDNTNIFVNKSIKINGQDAVSTTINGNNNQIFSISEHKTVSIEGLTFLNGQAEYGGAINNLGHLKINNCNFRNNLASLGGAVYSKSSLNITRCNFLNNQANNKGLGGAIYTREGTCNIVGTVFDGNSAAGDGGAVNNNLNGNLKLINTNFHGNTARTGGALSNGQDCELISCEFNQNTAEYMGGAVYSMGNLKIDNGQFNQNTARFDVGGAIKINDPDSDYSTNITRTNFKGNGALNYGAISSNQELYISTVNFINNHAGENGGAIGCTNNLNLENSTLSGNTADKYGGAICGFGGLTSIRNTDLMNNTAQIGGAVVLTSASLLYHNKFITNTAKQGGAIYNSFKGDATHPSAKFVLNDLTKNSAKELGGAVANSGAITFSKNNFTMNEILEDGTGGAIFNANGTIYIDGGNEFFHNIANQSLINTGGGIANFEGSHVFVLGQGNHFTDSNILNKGFLEMKDCVIEKNTEDGNYLDNKNSQGFKQDNCQVIQSNHYYDTVTQVMYDSFVRHGKKCIGNGAPTHLDNVNPITAHKGDNIKVKPQLWTSSYYPWDVRVDNVTVKFSLYDKHGKYVDEGRVTSWWGYTEINIDTSNLNPGEYCLLVSYNGENPSNTVINNPIYLSCFRSVSFTVTA